MGFLSSQTHEFKGEHKVGWILYNKTKGMQQPKAWKTTTLESPKKRTSE